MGQATSVLVTGASGQLGSYLLRELARGPADVVAWSGSRRDELGGVCLCPVDLRDSSAVAAAFGDCRPSVIIHAAAMSSVANCFRAPSDARAVNVQGTACLAELATRAAARFIFVSTDLVFDGTKGNYRESDAPSPLSVYGQTKAEAERVVRAMANHVVVRLSLLYGPTRVGRPTFFDEQVSALAERRPVTLFEDEWRTPLDLVTATRAIAAIARSNITGVLHVGGPQRVSRLEMGRRLATCLGLDASNIVAASRASAPTGEPRPRDTSLDCSRWRELFPGEPWPNIEQAMQQFE